MGQQNNLTLGSFFDGSAGFPLGGLISGITPLWASEIERIARGEDGKTYKVSANMTYDQWKRKYVFNDSKTYVQTDHKYGIMKTKDLRLNADNLIIPKEKFTGYA